MTTHSQIAGNKFRTILLILLFMVIFFAFFYIAGLYFQDAYSLLIFGLLFAVISSIGSYFYSDRIVLAMSGAKSANKSDYFDFYTSVENMSIAAGLPIPKIYVIEDDSMNAFATGRNPKHAVVVATTGLLGKLDRAETEAVIAHEISHIKNYDVLIATVVAVLVGTLVFAADWMLRIRIFGGNNRENNGPLVAIVLLVSLILMPILATLMRLAISRNREYLADASGALLNRNPDALANALIKISGDNIPLQTASNATAHLFIENPFKSTSRNAKLISLFATHPPVEERVKRLREM